MRNREAESIEALSWLEQQDGKERSISESSEEMIADNDLLRLVSELYSAGAVEVIAYGVTIEEEIEDGNSLQITLPQDKLQRAALFTIQERVLREIGSSFDADEEDGQRSIGIAW